MKKYRKQIYRITSLLCCIVLIVSLAALPAAAMSEIDNSISIDLLETGCVNPLYSLTSTNHSVTVNLPSVITIRYVDFVIAAAYAPSLVTVNGTSVTINTITSGLYRCYGEVNINSTSFVIDFTGSNYGWLVFQNFDAHNVGFTTVGDTTWMSVGYSIGSNESSAVTTQIAQSSIGSKTQVTFPGGGNSQGFYDFYAEVNFNHWQRFDYVDFQFRARVSSISSIVAKFGNINLPISVSYLATNGDSSYMPDFDSDVYSWVDSEGSIVDIHVRVDLRGIEKNTTVVPLLIIRGDYDIQFTNNYFAILNYSGSVLNSNISEFTIFWYRIRDLLNSNHSNLKNFLADLFGKDDAAALQAQQSQEQLNVQVNAQVSDAVADWDVHIVEVQDGYDSGFEGAVPALSWLSSLAEGIFGNMGWFGSIYLLVGLISVYVLFLNKGGLIGRRLK